MRPTPIVVPPDRFTRLEQVDEQNDRLIYRVAALSEEAFTVSVGELLTIDPKLRGPDFQCEFAVLTTEGVVLAGIGPLHGRPKNGGTGLTLRPRLGDNAKLDTPLSPAVFARACVGRRVENAEAPAREPVPNELWAEIDRARADEERIEADRVGTRLAAARAAGWRAPSVNSHLSENSPQEPENFRGPEGAFDIDRITRKLIDAGRIKNAYAASIEDGTSTFLQVRTMACAFARVAYKLAKLQAEEWPQAKADRRKINENLRLIVTTLEGFLDHIDVEDARLFVDSSIPVPTDEDRTAHFLLDVAEVRVAKSRAQARSLIKKIQYLEQTFQDPGHSRDGRKDHLASEFVKQMAFIWRMLTGETPGRTGNGLFGEFVRSAWDLVGWEAKPADFFAKRIETGAHLDGG